MENVQQISKKKKKTLKTFHSRKEGCKIIYSFSAGRQKMLHKPKSKINIPTNLNDADMRIYICE